MCAFHPFSSVCLCVHVCRSVCVFLVCFCALQVTAADVKRISTQLSTVRVARVGSIFVSVDNSETSDQPSQLRTVLAILSEFQCVPRALHVTATATPQVCVQVMKESHAVPDSTCALVRTHTDTHTHTHAHTHTNTQRCYALGRVLASACILLTILATLPM